VIEIDLEIEHPDWIRFATHIYGGVGI
jgi:hypothetical protein